VVVVKEVICRASTGWLIQCGSIHDEDVWPAVVVVVENSYAGAGGLDDVFLRLFIAGDNLELQAGFFGDVLKVRDGLRL